MQGLHSVARSCSAPWERVLCLLLAVCKYCPNLATYLNAWVLAKGLAFWRTMCDSFVLLLGVRHSLTMFQGDSHPKKGYSQTDTLLQGFHWDDICWFHAGVLAQAPWTMATGMAIFSKPWLTRPSEISKKFPAKSKNWAVCNEMYPLHSNVCI